MNPPPVKLAGAVALLWIWPSLICTTGGEAEAASVDVIVTQLQLVIKVTLLPEEATEDALVVDVGDMIVDDAITDVGLLGGGVLGVVGVSEGGVADTSEDGVTVKIDISVLVSVMTGAAEDPVGVRTLVVVG